MNKKMIPSEYSVLLNQLKEKIRHARTRASLSVNKELVLLYWQIGREILKRQEVAGWGGKVIAKLAEDLHREFPEMKGLSSRNLMYMRQFAETWPDELIVQQLVAQIPWGHNLRLLDRVKDPSERQWYLRTTIEHGWSRATLDYQIDSGLFGRKGKGVTNFKRTLPAPQSELAQQVLKDSFNFGFLGLSADAKEREIHQGLLQLRCFVVIELKAIEFKPEHAGKLNFYLSAVDDMLRHPDDQPSIGLIICRNKKGLIAEYALRGMHKPMGVAEHLLSRTLPEKLKGQLPTIEELEVELAEKDGV